MVCPNVTRLYDTKTRRFRTYPCGKCMPCRIQRTSQWALRLMNELPYWNYEASFITLTYDDEHLPSDFGLHVEDLQKFWKRLRKDVGNKIRYYACGEYGDLFGRPHYHAIVFGFGYNELNRQILKDNWRLCWSDRFDIDRFRNKEQGFAPVTPDDIRYVTGYIQKKLSGKLADETYGDRLPPFQCCSRGLGLDYALEHKNDIENRNITFRGHKVSIPRYYLKKLGIKSDNISNFAHKVEFLENKGIEFPKTNPHSFVNFVEYEYDKMSLDALEQYDKEINARYCME